MHKPNICPKCQNTHFLGPFTGTFLSINLAVVAKVFLLVYVCMNCGYSELYFDDESMNRIRKKFKIPDLNDNDLSSPSLSNSKTLDKFCPNCSNQIINEDVFCPSCGSKLN